MTNSFRDFENISSKSKSNEYHLNKENLTINSSSLLKCSALKATVPENLYSAFQDEVKDEFNVTDVFDSWVSQPGFPVLNVHLSNDRKHIEIQQKRFLDIGPNHGDKTQYKVPLTWASNNENTDFSYTKPMAMLLNSSLAIELKKPIDWIVFNVQHSGKYMVLSRLKCFDNNFGQIPFQLQAIIV